ncbi:PREDICTED: sugar phosphate exchanger 2-like [Thamnophis sirtalis]|uniref:Sugar phosphate exchanger 2-like n=1 Tax=Thamnophis sirtalis TaxID=35019 RepID=A0A6I9Y8X3_9SAUR|nr:PREDICTED: sugar phosphate exchanger 2-like [Thamnophis sirtalis]
MSTLFDVGGIIGGIVAGLVSDYTGGRATTCCAMLILAAPMLFLYNYVGQNGLGTSIAMLIICGGLVNGPYALITTAVSADLVRMNLFFILYSLSYYFLACHLSQRWQPTTFNSLGCSFAALHVCVCGFLFQFPPEGRRYFAQL